MYKKLQYKRFWVQPIKSPWQSLDCSRTLTKLSDIHERKIRESLELNNIEAKAEYDKSIEVLNRDRTNIVNTNSWKPLFHKINMVRHANAMKKMFLGIRFNNIIHICIYVEPQRNQLVDYCPSRMVWFLCDIRQNLYYTGVNYLKSNSL